MTHSVDIIRKSVNKQQLKELMQINPWIAAGRIAFEYGLIAAAIYISETLWNPLVYLAAIIVIGSRFHAIAVLMHDASHGVLFANRTVNKIVGLVLPLPIFMTSNQFAKGHLPHHQFNMTDKDPDLIMKKMVTDGKFDPILGSKHHSSFSKQHFYKICVKHLLGLETKNIFRLLMFYNCYNESARYIGIRILLYTIIFAALIMLGYTQQLILYWLIPIFTTLSLSLYVRSVAEHYTSDNSNDPLDNTRTTYPTWWEKMLFVPCNIWCHIPHHLYPSVPYYNLPKLDNMLNDIPEYKRDAYTAKGYFNELVAQFSGA